MADDIRNDVLGATATIDASEAVQGAETFVQSLEKMRNEINELSGTLKIVENNLKKEEQEIEKWSSTLTKAEEKQAELRAKNITSGKEWDKVKDTISNARKELEKWNNRAEGSRGEMGKLTERLKELQGRIEKGTIGMKDMGSIISLLPPPIQSVINSMTSFIGKAQALIGIPLAPFIGVVVAALTTLTTAFKTVTYWMNETIEGQKEAIKWTGFWDGVVASFEMRVANLGKTLYNAFGDFLSLLPNISKELREFGDKAVSYLGLFGKPVKTATDQLAWYTDKVTAVTVWKGAAVAQVFEPEIRNGFLFQENERKQQELEIEKNKWLPQEAELDKQIAEYRKLAYENTGGSAEKRKKQIEAYDEMEKKIDEKYKKRIEFAKREAELYKERLDNSNTNIEGDKQYQQLLANITREETAQISAKMMSTRRKASAENALDNKGESEVKKARQEEQRKINQNETDRRYEEDLAIQAKEYELQRAQMQIDGMKQGTDKYLAQIELESKRKQLAIEKERIQLLRKSSDETKQRETVNNPDTVIRYTAGELTPEQEQHLYDLQVAQEAEAERKRKEIEDRRIANRIKYYEKYGELFEKELAITEEYNKKIANANDEYEVKSLQKELDNLLRDLKFDQFKEGIDWDMLFGDIEHTALPKLKELRKALREFINSKEFKELKPEDQKTVMGSMKEINTAVQNKSTGIFGGYNDAKAEYENARQARQEAYNELQNLQTELDLATYQNADEAILNAIKESIENAKKKLQQTESVEQGAQTNLTNAQDKTRQKLIGLSSAIAQLGNTADMSLSELGNVTASVASLFGEAAGKIGGVIGAIMGLLDVINKQGLVGFGQNLFRNVFGAVGSVLSTFTGTIDGLWGVSNTGWQSSVESLIQSNALLNNSITNLTNEIAEGGIQSATANYDAVMEALNQSIQNTQKGMRISSEVYDNGFLGMGGTGSSGHKVNEAVSQSQWKAISQLLGKNVLTDSDFFSLSPEEMKKVADNLAPIYSEIYNAAKEGEGGDALVSLMEQYIDLAGKAETATNQWLKALTSYTFDEFKDEFKSLLSDVNTGLYDVAETFDNMMRESILNKIVDNTDFENSLKALQEKLAKAVQDGASEGEVNAIKEELKGLYSQVEEQRDALYDEYGLDTNANIEASRKSIANISQDTADSIDGRLTNIDYQVTLRNQLEAQKIALLEASRIDLDAMNASIAYQNQMVSEMRDIQMQNNDYLFGIERNTRPIAQMNEKITEIADKIKTL